MKILQNFQKHLTLCNSLRNNFFLLNNAQKREVKASKESTTFSVSIIL